MKFEWRFDGNLISLSDKDKKMNIFDLRSSKVIKTFSFLTSNQINNYMILRFRNF